MVIQKQQIQQCHCALQIVGTAVVYVNNSQFMNNPWTIDTHSRSKNSNHFNNVSVWFNDCVFENSTGRGTVLSLTALNPYNVTIMFINCHAVLKQ